MENKFGIINDRNEIVDTATIAKFIQSYCRVNSHPNNRKTNLAFLVSDEFLSQYQGQRLGFICKVAVHHQCWGQAPVQTIPEENNKIGRSSTDRHPAPAGLTIVEKYIWELTTRILSDYKVPHYIQIRNRNGSSHCFEKSSTQLHRMIFGKASVERAFNKRFEEYKCCEWVIAGHSRHSWSGARLLAIHESAHAVEIHMFGRANGDVHGYKFQETYRKLLAEYDM